ncbi:nucleoside diphosphate kinase [Auriculariales sp. MPI-PUGE-AT-0066]|nr:nucleoside diphosphate kinase [Auriculariales sp. MPI-PUGE-AT-0066]
MSSSSSTPNRSPQPGTGTHTPRVPITRTLAIIKAHALKHRLTIERSIVDAGFEIVKERQMAFDPEGSRDTLVELFGRDAHSLAEDPVWVYVLERRRAVEVWLTLMGPEDPELARVEQPNSLRAIYGLDVLDNGNAAFIGSPDPSTAETQIATLFASSPPFPTTDDSADELDQDPMLLSPPVRPANGRQYDTVRSANSGSSQRSSVSKSPANSNGRLVNGTGFKARAVPASIAAPDIAPRLTRAASLRIGLPPDQTRKPTLRATRTKEEQQATFMDVPGHKRSAPIAVASTAAPTIAPRATKASVLRETKDLLGSKPTWGAAKKETVETYDRPKAGVANFENVPGHKRRESITVASTATPTVVPRANRAAELRAAKLANNTAPTSFK